MATTFRTPSSRRSAALVQLSRLIVVGLIATLWSTAVRAADAPSLRAHITTNRGCLETGGSATFALGETITLQLRADSGTYNQAQATLSVYRPNGFLSVFSLGWLFTNETYLLRARAGTPEGVHTLRFKAAAGGVVSSRSCSFRVVGVVTTPTPKPTRTPTFTRTITPTHPPVTPGAALQPYITTNRGCDETGDNPVFFVGERITVSFEIGSDTKASATATLYDMLANGSVHVFSFGTILTNRTYTFPATVAPPLGTEVLRLRAGAFGVSSVNAYCSFTIAAPPTRTRTSTRTPPSTRTPTRTRTATPSRTPTRTATATATVP